MDSFWIYLERRKGLRDKLSCGVGILRQIAESTRDRREFPISMGTSAADSDPCKTVGGRPQQAEDAETTRR